MTDPYDARVGDDCGLIKPDGSICDGTLARWEDVLGRVPGCECRPPYCCSRCIWAPLVCSTCREPIK